MEHVDRRTALIGLAVTATAVPIGQAVAQSSGAPRGDEIAPGVRSVRYPKTETMIPNYKTISMRDLIYQPGTGTSSSAMENDMVCHVLEGELTVDTGHGSHLYKKGDLWGCAKGMPEHSKNNGSAVAIMRVIDLLPS
ncbi:MAG TPA: hypothetical protein VHL98_15560 [Microvirga sp.]|jgi:quercetin dioxygenase-like cupin family protein|nr:hypothetical protein [Microvirga sp.]